MARCAALGSVCVESHAAIPSIPADTIRHRHGSTGEPAKSRSKPALNSARRRRPFYGPLAYDPKMDRGNIGRLLLIVAGVFLMFQFMPKLMGGGSTAHQPLRPEGDRIPLSSTRPPEQRCDIWGPGFRAVLTSRGASIAKFTLLGAKYQKDGHAIDLSTTPDIELRRQLRFHFRNPAAKLADDEAQLKLDSFDYQLVRADGKSCEFTYRTDETELRQVVKSSGRPYELIAEATITNLAATPRRHELAVFTDAWRTEHEVKGGMFRVS